MDANVIVVAQVRDLLLRMAEADLIDVRWSRQILEETRRALTTRLHLTAAAADKMLGNWPSRRKRIDICRFGGTLCA
jgi:hypothetical protein